MRLKDKLQLLLSEPQNSPDAQAESPERLGDQPRDSAIQKALQALQKKSDLKPSRSKASSELLASFRHMSAPPSFEEALLGNEEDPVKDRPFGLSLYRYPIGSLHGAIPLSPFHQNTHLKALTNDARLEDFDPRQALYLDIETTGLEHGAGTTPFMVGISYFEGDSLLVRQATLRSPDEEPALLLYIWEQLARFPFLVTFNGKSFDLTILQMRMVMNRISDEPEIRMKLKPHLDLLYLSRNLYKNAFENTKLQTLEREVLSFQRENDMPGSMAPSCWFHWLHHQDPRPLRELAKHNLWDVLTMVALTRVLSEISLPEARDKRSPLVWQNLAYTYLRLRSPFVALKTLDYPPENVSPPVARKILELEFTASRRVRALPRLEKVLTQLIALEPDNLTWQRTLKRYIKKPPSTS